MGHLGYSGADEHEVHEGELAKQEVHRCAQPGIHVNEHDHEDIAHQIFAASDIFIVPSLFEPCGLTQMIALKYGAIPVVRKTGGLVDTIFDVDHSGLPFEQTNGFVFENSDNQSFEEALSTSLVYDMGYRFLTQLQETERAGGFKDGRRYVMEGYLYPDTYDFYTDAAEADVISKLLATFNRRFEDAYYERCEELGYTVDEVINIASIVQMETKYDSEYGMVSSLYHNRLNNPSSFPRLQCDSTYLYVYPDRRPTLTLDEMKSSDSPYSTYSHDGLPPSAICSPSLDAIIAALYPNPVDESGVKHTYYYMYARPNGYHYFATTESQHIANMERAKSEVSE